MMQKIVVGLLFISVVGAVGVGVYDASKTSEPVGATELLATGPVQAQPAANTVSATPTPDTQPLVVETPLATEPAQPVQQEQATDQIGDPWQDSGTITGFDTNGMFLTGTLSGAVYVELGPEHYWQQQSTQLSAGETVRVEGFFNGDQYHAVRITKADGTQLQLRTTEGLPLWSGGAQNGNTAMNSNGEPGQQTQGEQMQIDPDAWITIEGVITATRGTTLTMETAEAELITLQLGQRSFVEEQEITFATGDDISVIGYWQNEQFKAGEITKVDTGERLMLLDPNGRPLWGGPGRSGEQGSGNSGDGGQGNSGNSSGGNGSGGNGGGGNGGGGNGGGGNGNGYQGGRNS